MERPYENFPSGYDTPQPPQSQAPPVSHAPPDISTGSDIGTVLPPIGLNIIF